MLCDLVIKALPSAHFWKCYCAAQSLGQGHVQKSHTSNKDLLLEQLLHLKHPDISSLLTGSSSSPESCMAARKLILQEWNWGPFLAFSKPCSDSFLPCNRQKPQVTWKWAETQTHSAQGCLQVSGAVSLSWDSPSWADELLWSGVVLWMTLGWTFGDSSNVHIISLR